MRRGGDEGLSAEVVRFVEAFTARKLVWDRQTTRRIESPPPELLAAAEALGMPKSMIADTLSVLPSALSNWGSAREPIPRKHRAKLAAMVAFTWQKMTAQAKARYDPAHPVRQDLTARGRQTERAVKNALGRDAELLAEFEGILAGMCELLQSKAGRAMVRAEQRASWKRERKRGGRTTH